MRGLGPRSSSSVPPPEVATVFSLHGCPLLLKVGTHVETLSFEQYKSCNHHGLVAPPYFYWYPRVPKKRPRYINWARLPLPHNSLPVASGGR